MNMLYEGLRQNSTIVIVPSTAVESMQLGTIAGIVPPAAGPGNGHPAEEKDHETPAKPERS
jgi:hypothetical protein